MKQKKLKTSQSRRKFLRETVTAGGTAAAALAVPDAVQADAESDKAVQEQSDGYRLSQHVLDYYKGAAS
ncbi:hypothetical protein BOW35_04000 [Solemya velum gill symbiont]|uniref:twin-arginine translocation signal domain-containing protein n=1 Tax=Solemya velum gill symbiont TaxID=2340 RepID=UPI0009988956|nr:twin-arginine translocation signal domain-containing protein [Solemya velum gill symbiont]OOZ15610.1 hypothetical protein BOW27_02995 [Solemya velum gill symbiont]OOZ18148.1 hypothetical protein BOW28_03055 [Solemya velum gill symbiont]OOZ20423.1 hypothetical protein BOW29_02050 [Solemya velum gill symbiont]OOZ22295.1 hypothetical protein BOW30_06150 [Solemya velum gill symbiont]OOZ24574.1 hypothetical protein BOW31_05720 [Solemya velum gill symbiont]